MKKIIFLIFFLFPLIAQCQDKGEICPSCSAYKAKKINVILITDEDCPFCSVNLPQQLLKDNFSGLKFKTLDYKTQEAKRLIEEYQITTLPTFIFPLQIKEEKNFEKLSGFFEGKKEKLILKKELSGVFLFLKRKTIPQTIDLFLDIYDENSKDLLESLIDFSKESKVSLNIYFVEPDKDKFKYSQEEIKIALAVKALYPKKFSDYLIGRLKNIESIDWLEPMEELGINFIEVRAFAKSKKIKEVVDKNKEFCQALGIKQGNAILINNNRLFKVLQIKGEDLERFF